MKESIKITIVNGWSDKNRGDSAIVLGIIKLLLETFGNPDIALMSEFGWNNAEFEIGYNVIKKVYPDTKILPALFPYPEGKNSLIRKFKGILQVLRSTLILCCPNKGKLFFFNQGEKESLNVLLESDMVISKGGHIFYCTEGGMKNIYSFYKHIFPLVLGKRAGKKTVIYSQTIGPFNGRLCKFLANKIFSFIDGISIREKISFDNLRAVGRKYGISLIPDAAFILGSDNIPEKKTAKNVIITPRQWGSRNIYDNYVTILSREVERLVMMGYHVKLINHCVGPTPIENDTIAVQDILKKLSPSALNSIQFIDTSDIDTLKVMKLYADADFLIGTRFHSVIFSIIAGTPAIAISYFGPKSRGIMKILGLEDLVLDITNLSEEKLNKIVDYIINNQKEINKKVKQNATKIITESREKGESFLVNVMREISLGTES